MWRNFEWLDNQEVRYFYYTLTSLLICGLFMVHAKMCLMGSYFHSCGCFEQSAHLLLVNVVRVALVIHRVEKLPPATITTFTGAINEPSRSFKIKNLLCHYA